MTDKELFEKEKQREMNETLEEILALKTELAFLEQYYEIVKNTKTDEDVNKAVKWYEDNIANKTNQDWLNSSKAN